MAQVVACPRCHSMISMNALPGSCPGCLLRLGLAETSGVGSSGTEADPAVVTTFTRPPNPRPPFTDDLGPSPASGVLPPLAGYVVQDELGRGGSGIVFRARQAGTDRTVALKFLLRGVGSATERQRFRTEIRSLGQLNHPNIVTVYDVGEADGCPYFAMEYLSGGSLGRRHRKHSYTPMEAAALTQTLARAVAVAHEAGVLHRDLKPGNILLAADGTPKIGDFGLSKRWEEGYEAVTIDQLTRTGELLGTPAYMAPEQASAKHGAIGPRTDVYGLGAILYDLCTNRPPFRGRDSHDTLRQVVHNPVIPPRNRNRKIPRGLEAICLKCLEKNPEDRYATTTELADDLARYQAGLSTRAQPLSMTRRVGRATWHHRSSVVLTIAVAAMIMVAAYVWDRIVKSSTNEDPDALVAQMEQDLRDGRPVHPIGPTGRPLWSRWGGEDGSFAQSGFNDDTCCVRSAGACRVELLREVPESGFRLVAEIRHEDTLDVGDLSAVGVYFNLIAGAGPGGANVETWYAMRYNDHAANQRPAFIPKTNHAALGAYARWIRPGQVLSPGRNDVAAIEFNPTVWGGLPGWRRIEIEARPTVLTFRWQDESGAMVAVGHQKYDQAFLDEIGRKVLTATALNAGEESAPAWPGWAPRGSLGLYVQRGQAAFRNVTIHP